MLAVSSLSRVEVPAALWRKARTRELSRQDAADLAAQFTSDFESDEPVFTIIDVDRHLLADAARLPERHGLYAYDAVQLACAMALRSVDDSVTFVCVDRALAAAARAEGFEVNALD